MTAFRKFKIVSVISHCVAQSKFSDARKNILRNTILLRSYDPPVRKEKPAQTMGSGDLIARTNKHCSSKPKFPRPTEPVIVECQN